MRNIKQFDLAKKLNERTGINVQAGNVASWERGTNPKIEIIEAIAEILDIPVQYLFDDSDKAIDKIVKDRYRDIFNYRESLKNINSIVQKVTFDLQTMQKLSEVN